MEVVHMYVLNLFNFVKQYSKKIGLFWPTLFVLIFVFSLLVPVDGDDFTFLAYRQGIESAAGYFDAISQMHTNLNGRVVGNFLQLLLVGTPFISALFRAVVMFSIAYLAVRIVSPKSIYMRNLVVMTVLFVPAHIFSQTYAWQAGFFNYVTSTVGFLLVIYILKNIFFGNVTLNLFARIALIVLTALTSLFAENVTITLLCLMLTSSAVMVVMKRFDKLKLMIWPLLGVIIGSLIMFSSPAYSSVAGGSDEYRSIGVENSLSQIDVYADKLYRLAVGLVGFEAVLVLILGLVVLGSCAFFQIKTSQKLNHTMIVVLSIGLLYPLLIFMQASGEFVHQSPLILQNAIKLLTVFAALGFVAAVVLSGLKMTKEWPNKVQTVTLPILAGFLLGPFILVEPFGGRNFLLSYILVCISFLTIIASISKIASKKADTASAIVLSILGILVIGMFAVIKLYELRNNQTIIESINSNASSVELRKYPFSKWVRNNNDPVKVSDYANRCECPYGIQCTDTCRYDVGIEYID